MQFFISKCDTISLPSDYLFRRFCSPTTSFVNRKKNRGKEMSSKDNNNDTTTNSLAATTGEAASAPSWTYHLPESFGIRASVQQSKYRWCVRESAMWGIATGTAMSLHRMRMGSLTARSINAGFLSFFTVYFGSYYFCVKRRDHKEKMIELMMKLNSFEHALNMPEPVPVDENHPFAEVVAHDNDGSESGVPTKQYVANLPERKEWQSPLPTQDAGNIFKEKDK